MARTVDTDHREALLAAAARHLVEHGIANQSLSEIAGGAGTSARMLVHHFGTRDALVAGALALARQSQLEQAARHFRPAPDAVAVLEASWRWLVADETLKFFRLFQQVTALERLGATDAQVALAPRLAEDWRPLLSALFAADRRYVDPEQYADLTIAFYRGLALELVREPRRRRHRRTFDRFIGVLRAAAA